MSTPMNYDILFYTHNNHITIRQLSSRKLYWGNEAMHKLLKKQDPSWDMFITKYGDDQIVTCIILDFDSEDNQEHALKDAQKLQKYTKHNGLNTVIVRSGNKGYHTYTQTAPWGFNRDNQEFNRIHFKRFVELITGIEGEGITIKYPTLDDKNLSAGLKGNIRIIGSIHPKTQERCRIIDGEFLEFDTGINRITDFETDCYRTAYKYAQSKIEEISTKQKEAKERLMTKYGYDPCAVNDLRQLMPQIYGGQVKEFNGYIEMQCPFHNDNHPSMMVTNVWYSCASCGEKGNWWTLREKGVVDFEDNTIKVNKKQ